MWLAGKLAPVIGDRAPGDRMTKVRSNLRERCEHVAAPQQIGPRQPQLSLGDRIAVQQQVDVHDPGGPFRIVATPPARSLNVMAVGNHLLGRARGVETGDCVEEISAFEPKGGVAITRGKLNARVAAPQFARSH